MTMMIQYAPVELLVYTYVSTTVKQGIFVY